MNSSQSFLFVDLLTIPDVAFSYSEPSQTDSPCDDSPISLTSLSDYTSGVSSTNDSPVNLLPLTADINHYLNQNTFQVFTESGGTDNPDPYDVPMRLVDEGLKSPFSSVLDLGDHDYDLIPEKPLTLSTHPDNIGELQHAEPSDVKGEIILCSEAVHAGQIINGDNTSAEYPECVDMENSSSPKPSIWTDEMQSQAKENMADEKEPPHILIDLRKIKDPYGLCMKIPRERIFICCLKRCKRCAVHGSFFSTEEEIHQHIDGEIKERPFMCETCQERFGQKKEGTRHVESKNKPCQYPCNVCKKAFGRADALKQHSHTHASQKNGDDSPNDKDQKLNTRAKKSDRLSKYPY